MADSIPILPDYVPPLIPETGYVPAVVPPLDLTDTSTIPAEEPYIDTGEVKVVTEDGETYVEIGDGADWIGDVHNVKVFARNIVGPVTDAERLDITGNKRRCFIQAADFDRYVMIPHVWCSVQGLTNGANTKAEFEPTDFFTTRSGFIRIQVNGQTVQQTKATSFAACAITSCTASYSFFLPKMCAVEVRIDVWGDGVVDLYKNPTISATRYSGTMLKQSGG